MIVEIKSKHWIIHVECEDKKDVEEIFKLCGVNINEIPKEFLESNA